MRVKLGGKLVMEHKFEGVDVDALNDIFETFSRDMLRIIIESEMKQLPEKEQASIREKYFHDQQ